MLYEIATTILAPFIALAMCFSKRGRERIFERFGFIKASGDFWGHGASVGEVRGLKPILDKLTDTPFITAVSPTAKDATLIPFDSRVYLASVFRQIKPRALIISESDIWPVLLREASKREIPIFYVNTRLTESGFKRIKSSSSLKRALSQVNFFFCEDEISKNRLKELGFDNISVEGNAKYEVKGEFKEETLRFVASAPGSFVTLASIHPGEEKVLFRLLKRVLQDKILVIAPRHREKFQYFERALIHEFGECRKLSDGVWGRIMLVDTIGDLGAFMERAYLNIVCGSFIPGIGGHNPLEGKGRPVVVGPYHEKVASVVLPDWIGVDKIERILVDSEFRDRISDQVNKTYIAQCGVGERVARKILEKI